MTRRFLLLTLVFHFSISYLDADETGLTAQAGAPESLSSLVLEKRDYYRKQYPDILFVVLTGGEEAVTEMITLDTLLGPEPVSLDYEHPKDLREQLMQASAERIWIMLKNQLPSAALFKADTPLGWQETICVITLDAHAVAETDVGATSFLLNWSETDVQDVPEKMRLDKTDYIKYTFDHEAYHCLKSSLLGPQTMSSHDLWGEYSHYKEEKAADSYALAMHIRDKKRITPFVDNIQRIRGMTLFSLDPNHFTYDAITELKKVSPEKLVKMNDMEVFNLANSIKQDLTGSYEEYLHYLAAVIEADRIMDVASSEMAELKARIGDIKPDSELVKKLVERSRQCLAELQGKTINE